MNDISITATKRVVTGKPVNKIRNAGQLPAVLYGYKTENQQIQVDEREFAKALKSAGETTIINLVVEGKTQPVLIHDIQRHYLNDNIIHVDFYAVNMTEKIKVKIPVHFIGESFALKSLGGTLVKNMTEVEVECLPADLPHAIEVDISVLNGFEDLVRVSDLKVPAKVTVLGNPDEAVVLVAAPRSEEEMAGLNAEVKEDVTAVEGVVKPEEVAAAEGKEPAEKKAKE
jgi:large subunit ribosomal protein L25